MNNNYKLGRNLNHFNWITITGSINLYNYNYNLNNLYWIGAGERQQLAKHYSDPLPKCFPTRSIRTDLEPDLDPEKNRDRDNSDSTKMLEHYKIFSPSETWKSDREFISRTNFNAQRSKFTLQLFVSILDHFNSGYPSRYFIQKNNFTKVYKKAGAFGKLFHYNGPAFL